MASNHYIPVFVDGDTEKEALSKYGVQGFPTLKFMDSQGTVTGEMRGRSPAGLISASKAAVDSIGRLQLTKPYMTLLKETAKLNKAVAKKKYKDALKAIAKIEGLGHDGSGVKAAMQEKAKIQEVAQTRFDEAKSHLEGKPKKAKKLLKKLSKDFAGLELADEAAELAKTIE